MPIRRMVWAVVLLALACGAIPVAGQPPVIERLAVQVADGELCFYSMDATGQFTPLDEFTRLFRALSAAPEGWRVLGLTDFAVSPDGRQIAFVAYHIDAAGQQVTALFVYIPGVPDLRQIAVPALLEPAWSPDSAAILLIPPLVVADAFLARDLYQYDLDADALVQLTDSPTGVVESDAIWLVDEDRIAFVGPIEPCAARCSGFVRNIYTIGGQGGTPSPLTDLVADLPASPDPAMPLYGACVATNLVWSETAARLYYSVSCDDSAHGLLYSVSLAGENRLEANLPAVYTGDEVTHIQAIYPKTALAGAFVVVVGRDPQDPASILHWRILDVRPAGTMSVLYEHDFSVRWQLTATSLSPNQRFLALGALDATPSATGVVIVVDLAAGRLLVQQETAQRVCDVMWLNDEAVLFTEFADGYCGGVPQATRVLNATTGAITDLSAELTGLVWVLP